eukprot:scaffold1208_cov31-Attheya_sp.AAC.2
MVVRRNVQSWRLGMMVMSDGDEGGYLCQYKPPSTVTLPPRMLLLVMDMQLWLQASWSSTNGLLLSTEFVFRQFGFGRTELDHLAIGSSSITLFGGV